MNAEHEFLPGADDGSKRKQQFSLLDLGLLVTALAVVFAFTVNTTFTGSGQVRQIDPVWRVVSELLAYCSAALSVVGCVFVLKRWWEEKKFATHPGHLIAIVLCFLMFTQWLRVLLFINPMRTWQAAGKVIAAEGEAWANQLYGTQLASVVIMAVLIAMGVWWYRWWWKLAFAGWCVFVATGGYQAWLLWGIGRTANQGATNQAVFNFAGNNGKAIMDHLIFASYLQGYAQWVAAALIVFAIVMDFFTKTRRDKLHWLGIGAWLLLYVVTTLARAVAARFLSPNQLYG